MNSTLKIQKSEPMALIDKIKVEIAKRAGLKANECCEGSLDGQRNADG